MISVAIRDFLVSMYAFAWGLAPSAAFVAIAMNFAIWNHLHHCLGAKVGSTIAMFFAITAFLGFTEHKKCKNCVLLVVDKSDLPYIYKALKERDGRES